MLIQTTGISCPDLHWNVLGRSKLPGLDRGMETLITMPVLFSTQGTDQALVQLPQVIASLRDQQYAKELPESSSSLISKALAPNLKCMFRSTWWHNRHV